MGPERDECSEPRFPPSTLRGLGLDVSSEGGQESSGAARCPPWAAHGWGTPRGLRDRGLRGEGTRWTGRDGESLRGRFQEAPGADSVSFLQLGRGYSKGNTSASFPSLWIS